MHTGNFNIKEFEGKDIAAMPKKERAQWVKLTVEQEEALKGLNRQQRREYYRNHKDEFKGLEIGDVAVSKQV